MTRPGDDERRKEIMLRKYEKNEKQDNMIAEVQDENKQGMQEKEWDRKQESSD